MPVEITEAHDHITNERITHLRGSLGTVRVTEHKGGRPVSHLVPRLGLCRPLHVDGALSFDATVAHWLRVLGGEPAVITSRASPARLPKAA